MKRLSIRLRLTAFYALFTLLLMLGLSSLVLWKVHHHLMNRADQALAEEIAELIEELNYFDDPNALVAELQKRYDVHAHFYFQIRDADLALVFQSRFLTNVTLPDTASPATIRGSHFDDIELEGLGAFRLLTMSIRDANARPLLLRALTSRANLDRDFQSYIRMFLTAVPAAVVAALISGYLLAGNLLSPIKKINSAVRQITAECLHERLPILNPHDELGELSESLNKTFDRLEKSIDSMRRFTSDAAHELRSPVAVLRSETEIALRKPRTTEEYKAVVVSTLNETIRLGAMVDQLLTLSRHDAGVQPLLEDEVPVGAVLQDVVSRFAALASEKGINLHAGKFPESFISGHDVWISQLFFNLLDNAIKFTPAGGSIYVSACQDEEFITVHIEDTGIGITDEQLPHIFDRFYRADAAREHYRGTGLGLSICQSIAKAHHGSIDATSMPGRGTHFVVRLPRLDNEPLDASSESSEPCASAP